MSHDHAPSRDRRADADPGGHVRRQPSRPFPSRTWPPPPSRRSWPGPASTRTSSTTSRFAQSYASGETPCIGRWAALQAGLPVSVPGFQLDRRCGGGLQAIVTAAMMVQTGAADVVLAGGVESMSNVEHYTTVDALGRPVGEPVPVRPAGPRPGAVTAGMAVRQDLRDDRDRRERGRAVRHHQGRGRRLRGPQPPARGGRLGGRAVRRRGRAGRRCRSAAASR